MDKTEIIKRISQIRIDAHLSARALSQKIGMNDGYINRLESKKDFLPRLETLLDILEVCGVSAERFSITTTIRMKKICKFCHI